MDLDGNLFKAAPDPKKISKINAISPRLVPWCLGCSVSSCPFGGKMWLLLSMSDSGKLNRILSIQIFSHNFLMKMKFPQINIDI